MDLISQNLLKELPNEFFIGKVCVFNPKQSPVPNWAKKYLITEKNLDGSWKLIPSRISSDGHPMVILENRAAGLIIDFADCGIMSGFDHLGAERREWSARENRRHTIFYVLYDSYFVVVERRDIEDELFGVML